jgi:dienelactone hydrolase
MSLALAYFGLEGLPDELERVPLEYVDHGLTYLRLQQQVDIERIGVVGVSKGGELALLMASMRPEIHAVAAAEPPSSGRR